jgi:basic membrane protein A
MEDLTNGSFDVFYGPIWDNTGELRVGEGENMPDEMLLNSFDWYVKGVHIHEK